MGKMPALAGALLVLSVGGVCLAQACVDGQRDQVRITEQVRAGDRAAALGLTVECRTHYDRRLFWDTAYEVGETPEARTGYAFFQSQQNDAPQPEPVGVRMSSEIGAADWNDPDKEPTGIGIAFRALYNQLAPGEERSKVISLRDYYDYYPIEAQIGGPTGIPLLGWERGESARDRRDGEDQAQAQTFVDFFKIPVLEKERVEIHVEKAASGNSLSWGSRSTADGPGETDADRFVLDSKSVVTDQACYFTFNTHTSRGNVVDTSHIPGGYGIYRLPFGGGGTELRMQELALAYPLDPEAELYDLYLSGDGTRLLLFTLEKGAYVLRVIGAAGMDTVQRLEFARYDGENRIQHVFVYDDFLAVRMWDERLILLTAAQDGSYTPRFVCELDDENAPVYETAALDWDGERLAVADFLWRGEWRNIRSCDFYLLVYDAAGLRYSGTYGSSLSVGDDLSYGGPRCEPVDDNPIAVRWGGAG